MATEDNEYFTEILDTLNRYQDRHGQRLYSTTLILLTTVITDASDAKKETQENESDQTVRNFNGKVSDDSI